MTGYKSIWATNKIQAFSVAEAMPADLLQAVRVEIDLLLERGASWNEVIVALCLVTAPYRKGQRA